MFAGHYGIAFALKRAEPRVSLGTLFLAVQLVDILWGGTLLLGWEHARVVPGYLAASPIEFLDYPITHSLLAGLGNSAPQGVAPPRWVWRAPGRGVVMRAKLRGPG